MDINQRYSDWVKRKNRLYFAKLFSEVCCSDRRTINVLIEQGLIPDSKVRLFLVSELYKRYIIDTVTEDNARGDKEKTLRRVAKELHYSYERCKTLIKNIKIGA